LRSSAQTISVNGSRGVCHKRPSLVRPSNVVHIWAIDATFNSSSAFLRSACYTGRGIIPLQAINPSKKLSACVSNIQDHDIDPLLYHTCICVGRSTWVVMAQHRCLLSARGLIRPLSRCTRSSKVLDSLSETPMTRMSVL
jgi:hypothetical protein